MPKVSELDVAGKKVLVRADLDVDPTNFESDARIVNLIPLLDYLKEKNAEIVLLGHRGRPSHKATAGEADPPDWKDLSLLPMQPFFDKWGAQVEENLRFDPGEEGNNPEFAKKLASLGDVYINEAFASSHREHASIVGLPKLLPHALGLRFEKEIENLSKVFNNPKRPLLFLISGVKEDKLELVKAFESLADKILVGGRLPDLMGDKQLESVRLQTGKTIIGNLVMDKEDITLNTIDVFEKEIAKAGTVVVSGPLGKFEDEGHRQGTKRIFEAVTKNGSAFKVAGGGDTEDAIRLLNLMDKLDWISVGGGAMLEFLSKKTLPGIEAMN